MIFFAFYGLLLLNIVTFCVYGIDKLKATHGKWRVPETSLFVLAIIGGSVGALMAMTLFRHKTQKASFRYTIPAILIVHVLMVGYLIYKWLDFVRPFLATA